MRLRNRNKEPRTKISRFFILAALCYFAAVFSYVFVLTAYNYAIPASQKVEYDVIAVGILIFGVVFALRFYQIWQRVNKALDRLERPP